MRTFSHHSMSSLLHLQGVIIYKIEEDKKRFLVRIGQPRKPSFCPNCQANTIHGHGKGRKRQIRHGINLSGKPVYLIWQGHRFKCRACLCTWTMLPPTSLVQGKRHFSQLCRNQALRMLQYQSFKTTKKTSGLSYQTLRTGLEEFMLQEPLVQIPQYEDISLGIDEHGRARKRMATTITLLSPKQKLLALLPHATAQSLRNWALTRMNEEQRARVTEIAMDMTKSNKKQLTNLFPNAQFVIDEFHVIAYLNTMITTEYKFAKEDLSPFQKRFLPQREKGLGITRLLYQGGDHWTSHQKEKVKTVFTILPQIAKLWYMKEEVRAIYRECRDKNEARRRWQYVLSNLPNLEKRTLTHFLEEILNYFDNHTTNAFTEGVHTKIKLMKRLSFGLRNPQVYVEKLSLAFVEPYLLTYPHTF